MPFILCDVRCVLCAVFPNSAEAAGVGGTAVDPWIIIHISGGFFALFDFYCRVLRVFAVIDIAVPLTMCPVLCVLCGVCCASPQC
jgi:hypothetical protein